MKCSHGYTFIEMLVGLFLSLLLLMGLMVMYLSEKTNYFTINALGGLQDRARFLSDLFRRNIREAGGAKCANNLEVVDQRHAIYGSENSIVIGKCMRYKKKNRFVRMRYFVGDTYRRSSKGDHIYALYRKPIDGIREEIITGVSSMAIQYGLATKNNRDVNHYVSANAVDNWKDVRSVSIVLSLNYYNAIKRLPIYVDLRERHSIFLSS